MLGENIKTLRIAQGFTQEELAIRLHVVRQTVSKWEKNLSVPDAAMLQKLAEVLDRPVNELLGADIVEREDQNALADQLARINEQLVIRNRRGKRNWTALAVVFAALLLLPMVSLLFAVSARSAYSVGTSLSENAHYSQQEVDEAIEVFQKSFRRSCRKAQLESISYDDELAAPLEQQLAAQHEHADVLILFVDFRIGAKPGFDTLQPNTRYTACPWLLTRGADGRWTLREPLPELAKPTTKQNDKIT